MGFEEQVPPIPTRLDEVEMLNKLEESWFNQPNYRFYMNEDLRLSKMEYSHYNMTARRKFMNNCLLISLFTLPLAYYSRRFYAYSNFRSGGIPFVQKLPYFHTQHTPYFDRFKAANTGFVWVYLLSTAFISYLITNWHYRSDENYDKFSKVKKML